MDVQHGWMHGWMQGWIHGWVDVRMEEWRDGKDG